MTELDEPEFTGAAILVVDDDDAVRAIVERTLIRFGAEVQSADSVAAGRSLITQTAFDAAVVDVGLQDGAGFDLVDSLRRADPPASAVLMTGAPSGRTVSRSIALGITEFLRKPFTTTQLVDAVRVCLETTADWNLRIADASPMDELAATDEAQEELARRADRLAAGLDLTPRERETLRHLVGGQQNHQIASSLNISLHTVKYHVRNILRKVGAESRTDLFRLLMLESAD